MAPKSLALALGGSDAQTTVAFTIDPSQLTHDATILQRAVPGALTTPSETNVPVLAGMNGVASSYVT